LCCILVIMTAPKVAPKVSAEQLDALLPPSLLDQLAFTYKVDAKNQIRLPGKLVFLCLLHNLLHHKDLTLRLLEETYQQKTGQHADHSSFGARLATIKPAYFEAIFQYLYQKMAPTATDGEKRALSLRFIDATTVTLSAKLMTFGLLVGSRSKNRSHRHVKSILELQEGLPQLLHICKEASENCDSVALGETMARLTRSGDLWIFDKGCSSRERLLDLHQRQAFFLTPHNMQGIATERVVFTLAQELLPVHPPKAEAAGFVVREVTTGVFANSQKTQNKRFAQMPLIVVRGMRFDKHSNSWKELTLLTNLELQGESHAGAYTFDELAQIYARRWDIEVFFKFVKQHLNWSHLTSRSENGIQVMLYMSLIVSLILLWYQRQTRIDRGWRSVKSWLAFDLQHWLVRAFEESFAALVLGRQGQQTTLSPVPALVE